MKTILFLVTLASSSILRAVEAVPYLAHEYDSAKWPQVNLSLSQIPTLKNLFDSGLRPYRFPALETSMLEVKHVNLTVLLDNGKRLPALPLEWMDIKVFTDGDLATLEAATPRLTLDRAREEMLKWLPLTQNGRTSEDLDRYLKAVGTDFRDFDDAYRGLPHGCSSEWKEPGWNEKGGGPIVVAWFRKAVDPSRPLMLYFKATWSASRPPGNRLVYHSGPIPPPPGYEHVSMEAPKNFGPDSAVDVARSEGVDIGESEEAKRKWRQERGLTDNGIPQGNASLPAERKVEKAPDPLPSPESSPVKWWLAALIAAALGLLWLLLGKRK